MKDPICSGCKHKKTSHRYESWFYEIPSSWNDCTIKDCVCEKYR